MLKIGDKVKWGSGCIAGPFVGVVRSISSDGVEVDTSCEIYLVHRSERLERL